MNDAKRLGRFSGIEFGKKEVIFVLFAAAISGVFLMLYGETKNIVFIIIAAASAVMLMAIFLKPVLERDNRKNNINSNIPFFITAFATLSVSGANRIDIIELLSKKDKLGFLKDDMVKLVNLVKNWKRGLSEAAMFLSQRTPSEVFADFLARFGHAIDSGQDFEEFVRDEAGTVMGNFETTYISSLYTFDLYKDMYVSLLLAFAFLITFILIMPILIPINIIAVLSLSMITIIMGEGLLVYGIKIVLPNDPIWHDTGIKTELQIKIRRIFIMAGVLSMVLLTALLATGLYTRIPFYFDVAIVITPFAWPGIVGSREEKKITKKDDMFGSFIRSLAGSASARGNMIIDALKSIVLHDFGSLTADIRNLYKRLTYRISNKEAWRNFSAETGSHLIEVFSESFMESVDLGSDAEKAGMVVADNFDKVIRLRKRRHSSVASYVGVIYGITGGLAFSLAISYGVLEIISKVFSTLDVSSLQDFGIFVAQPPSELFIIEIFIVAILFLHSFVAGTALEIADGGRVAHSLHHAVIMIWIVSFVIYGTLQVVVLMLGGGL
ncbi:type II secretion system F family protein [Oxyplasma meridianum]|uniref:Type II secretion system F family protein n=1 Tax=Oxyplasma meridianum TaxID=3073602 RepID=A0AAX4NEF0_9ARCH